jgi:SAM-dependent methyltransferase
MKTWKQIWENRNLEPITASDSNLLQKLICADGFDGGGGSSHITTQSWLAYIATIKHELAAGENDSFFEVGCGSGAILYPLRQAGHPVGGLDWSETLIAKAAEILPGAELTASEAATLPVLPAYDHVIANSMFFYFPHFDYAAQVLNRMYQKARKGVAILDVPDLQTKNRLEAQRRSACADYDRKYKNLQHLYYPQSWFLEFAERQRSAKIVISRQNIAGYGYNGLRFNCFILKNNSYQ